MSEELITPSVRDIQAAVARRFGVTVLDLVSDRRGKSVTRPRHVAIWIARHTTTLSLPQIGRLFGRRDHTTVMHALARVDERMTADAEFSAIVWSLLESVDCGETVERRRAMMRVVA